MNYILGISAFYHDSAITLIKDGEIKWAFQEERFTRVKQDSSFPKISLLKCLELEKISLKDISYIAYYEDPELKFQRIINTYKTNFPQGAFTFLKELPNIKQKRNILTRIKTELEALFPKEVLPPFFISQHHISHAASAFYPSPYEKAAILCVDGVGEWSTTSGWLGEGNSLKALFDVKFPSSLGLLYSAFTYYCGFKVDSGEYKLMGLAPYGKPIYADKILKELITVENNGSFSLNQKYFDYCVGNCMINKNFEILFNGEARKPESTITQKEMDLAASIQYVTEEVMLGLAKKIKALTNAEYLCLAGGVALNCVSNGKILKSKIFKDIFIQPASGDSGCSLGAALYCFYQTTKTTREKNNIEDSMQGSYLGNSYDNKEIEEFLIKNNAYYEHYPSKELIEKTASELHADKVVGWFQGRMEFGPRSLGARSILGNPKSSNMQSTMNLKIKNRESFRPFAPAIIASKVNQWFDIQHQSPYMLIVAPVLNSQCLTISAADQDKVGIDKLKTKRSNVPAITHVDYSARIQTVDGKYNPLFYQLLSQFNNLSNCPILINTSFNVRGEPIVESPKDAYQCFMRTEMDVLVLGNYFLYKNKQPKWEETLDWRKEYALD